MVYPLEKILKIVASFSRFPTPPPPQKKNAENSIFFAYCIEKVFRKGI